MGYTLGGGVGWLARRHGLASNSVTALELVTPAGELVRADAETEPDLFWALRGGGGSFGVVTAIEFRLYPVESVNAGWLIWPWEEARACSPGGPSGRGTVPDEVTSVGRLLQLPPLPDLPDAVRGRQLVVVEAAILADEDEAARLLAPLRELDPEIDTFAQVPADGAGRAPHGPARAGAGRRRTAPHRRRSRPRRSTPWWTSPAPGSGSPLLITVEVRHVGGALGGRPAAQAPSAASTARFLVFAAGIVMSPEAAPAVADAGARANAALSRWGAGRAFLNFADVPTDAETMFDPQAYRRLREIRSPRRPRGPAPREPPDPDRLRVLLAPARS